MTKDYIGDATSLIMMQATGELKPPWRQETEYVPPPHDDKESIDKAKVKRLRKQLKRIQRENPHGDQ